MMMCQSPRRGPEGGRRCTRHGAGWSYDTVVSCVDRQLLLYYCCYFCRCPPHGCRVETMKK